MAKLFISFTLGVIAFLQSCPSIHIEMSLGGKDHGKVSLSCKSVKPITDDLFQENRALDLNDTPNFILASKRNIIVPQVTLNSSNRYRCKIESPMGGIVPLRRSLITRRFKRDEPNGDDEEVSVDGSCRVGYRIEGERCLPCSPGSYSSGQETQCFDCPKNFYQSSAAADSCFPCPGGKSTITTGANSVVLCTYLNSDGRSISAWDPMWIMTTVLLVILVACAIALTVLGAIEWCNRKQKKKKPKMPLKRPQSVIPLLTVRKEETEEEDDYEELPLCREPAGPWTTSDEENIYEEPITISNSKRSAKRKQFQGHSKPLQTQTPVDVNESLGFDVNASKSYDHVVARILAKTSPIAREAHSHEGIVRAPTDTPALLPMNNPALSLKVNSEEVLSDALTPGQTKLKKTTSATNILIPRRDFNATFKDTQSLPDDTEKTTRLKGRAKLLTFFHTKHKSNKSESSIEKEANNPNSQSRAGTSKEDGSSSEHSSSDTTIQNPGFTPNTVEDIPRRIADNLEDLTNQQPSETHERTNTPPHPSKKTKRSAVRKNSDSENSCCF